MNIRRIITLGCIVWGLSYAGVAWGIDAATQQHIDELRAQIDALERQADQYRGNIAEQQTKADSLKKEIAILQAQIKATELQISATDARIDETHLEIEDVQQRIRSTQDTMSQKRAAIGRMVFFLDQRDHEDLLASLFKYRNLSDFVSQVHDIAHVQSDVLNAIDDLADLKTSLESDHTDLQSKETSLQGLKDEAAQHRASLSGVQSEKDRLLRTTKGQEALYQKQLKDVEKKEAAFFSEMQKLESQIIAGGLYIVHVTAVKVPPRGTKIFSRPEDGAHLTQGYGMTTYARRGGYGGAPHNGIDYAAGYGTPIKSIGEGTMIARGTNDGWGNWIAIQHPNNLVSLYGHMSAFNTGLNVGSAVQRGQVIGFEGNTGHVTGAHVHLSLYRDFFTYINTKNGQLYFNYFEGSLNPSDYVQ